MRRGLRRDTTGPGRGVKGNRYKTFHSHASNLKYQISRHTSHVTRHTSHVTRHTSIITGRLAWFPITNRSVLGLVFMTKQPIVITDITGVVLRISIRTETLLQP